MLKRVPLIFLPLRRRGSQTWIVPIELRQLHLIISCMTILEQGHIGGGTALMCREGITVIMVAVGEKRSFEFSEWIILGQGSRKIRIVIVYRLQ